MHHLHCSFHPSVCSLSFTPLLISHHLGSTAREDLTLLTVATSVICYPDRLIKHPLILYLWSFCFSLRIERVKLVSVSSQILAWQTISSVGGKAELSVRFLQSLFPFPGGYVSVELRPLAAVSVQLFSGDTELQINGPVNISLPLPDGFGQHTSKSVPAWFLNRTTGEHDTLLLCQKLLFC